MKRSLRDAIIVYAEKNAGQLTPRREQIIAAYLLEGISLGDARNELFSTGLRFSFTDKGFLAEDRFGWELEDMNDE
jgi:hypothetical protein